MAKEVTHFVTDKQQSGLNSPLPSPKTPQTPKTPINSFTDVGSSIKSFSNESKVCQIQNKLKINYFKLFFYYLDDHHKL